MTHCTGFTVCVLPIHLLRQHQGLPNNSTVTGGGDHSESFYLSGCVEFKRLFYQDLWFFKKKLLLLWGLLNKDLIALNACVQGKWKHAKLCNSSALDIWQRTIVGYNSWLVPIWGLNQKTEFGSQIYHMYGFFSYVIKTEKVQFLSCRRRTIYIFSRYLQIRQHWLHWQHNYLCFSYILHYVCLSVIVGIGRLTERWMNLDLGSVYYQVYHWMTVGTTRLLWYCYTHFMLDGGRGIWGGGEGPEPITPNP